MPKKKFKSTDELKREFLYPKDTENGNELCNRCGSVFSIAHGGRADVSNHFKNQKHKLSVEAAASSSQMTSFFQKCWLRYCSSFSC